MKSRKIQKNVQGNVEKSRLIDGNSLLTYRILVWCFFILSILILAGLTVIDVKLAVGWLGAVLLFVWFWLDVGWGLWMLIISVLFGQIVKVGLGSEGGLLFSDLVIVVLLVIWMFKMIRKREAVNWNILIWWLGFFWLMGTIINILWSHEYSVLVTQKMWLYWIRLIIYSTALPITWSIVCWNGQWQKWWKVYLTTGFVFLLLGLIQLKLLPDISFLTQFGWDPHQGRLLSTFLDPNFAGAFLIIFASICLSFYVSMEKWSKQKMWYGLLAGLFLIGIVLTLSRSALLAVGIVFALLTLWKDKKIFILGLFLGALFVFYNPRLAERLQGIYQVDETAQLRIKSWEDNFAVAKDNYWIGVGYNALAEEQFRRGVIEDIDVHSAGGSDSSYVTIWSTLGIVGLGTVWILYVWFMGLALRIFKNIGLEKNYRYFVLGSIFGIGGVLLHAQFTNSLFYPHIFIPVLVLMGIVMGGRGKVSSNK